MWSVGFFFFFKQKTAYEMRISDWSSDVCSSDLVVHRDLVVVGAAVQLLAHLQERVELAIDREVEVRHLLLGLGEALGDHLAHAAERLLAVLHAQHVGVLPGTRSGCRRRPSGCRSRRGCRRSEEHTSELQSLMSTSYAVFCWKKKK